MPRTLTLAISTLALSACLRFGYATHPPAADGGMTMPPDAGTAFDASTKSDGSHSWDATVYGDAAASLDGSAAQDASGVLDAASKREPADAMTSSVDGAAPQDASASSDASANPDASTTEDAGTPCAPSPVTDYCHSLPALPAEPNIDGVLDCGPQLSDLTAIGWTSTAEPLPSDNHARYAAAWRPNGLYIYVEVDDPSLLPALSSQNNPWCGDGVELYADTDGSYPLAPNYDDPGAMQLIAAAPPNTPGTVLAEDALYHTKTGRRIDKWTANHIAVKRANGYALEALITAAEIKLTTGWTLTAGSKVGFDIAVNVSASSATSSQKVDCGYGIGQYYLRVSQTPCTRDSCRPHANPAAFCTATLQ